MFHETLQPIQICTVIDNFLGVITFFENLFKKKVLEVLENNSKVPGRKENQKSLTALAHSKYPMVPEG